MEIQADTMADEAVVLSMTPSYLVYTWRHVTKRYSLLTGIPHIEVKVDFFPEGT